MKNPPIFWRSLCSSLLALTAAAFVPVTAQASLKDYPLQVKIVAAGPHIEVVVQNSGPLVMTVRLQQADAVSSDMLAAMRAVPAYSSVRLERIPLRDGAKRPDVRVGVQVGDHQATHKPDTRYRLPFEDGRTYRITQAYGDRLTTHAVEGMHYAVDVAMPEYAPVAAARDGLIADVVQDYRWGDPDPRLLYKANYVTILHDDGTVALYGHLAQRESPVKAGQRVTAGTVIGYAGSTGFSPGPHLHFAISRPYVASDGTFGQDSLPFTFYDDWKGEFAPRRGMLATAWSAEQLAAAGKSTPARGASPTISDAQAARTPTSDPTFIGTAASKQSTQQAAVEAAPAQAMVARAAQERAVPETRSGLPVETSMSIGTTAASASRAADQWPLSSNTRHANEAGGWTTVELMFISLALALAGLFVLRAWSQRTASRSFGA
ncbi:MAG TPA: M23 family metallopeptidase [Burkholderiales bacterium]|nr:M23 family metallopeptidase [Burkholderiales bacterium]